MKINANVNLTGDLNVEDASNDSVLTIKDDVNGGTLSIESTANDANNVQAGTINFDPGESTGSEVAASITAQSSGTTATNRGGKITIKTKSDNGNLLNRLFIDKNSLETENLVTANINATTINLQAGGANKLTTNNNYVTAAVPVALPDGSASAPVLTNTGDENTGIYFSAADTVNIATNGIERLNINNSTITAGRNIDMQSTYQINNLPDPTTNQQASTKAYTDTKIAGTSQTFTSSGTWTKPSGARKVEVSVLGAGSGGTAGGVGGGGGAFFTAIFDATLVDSSVSVTVGAGGEGGAAGTNASGTSGGSSSFGELITASGASVASGGTGQLSFYTGGSPNASVTTVGTCTQGGGGGSSRFGGGAGGSPGNSHVQVSDCNGGATSTVNISILPGAGGCIGTTSGKANNALKPNYYSLLNTSGGPQDVFISPDGLNLYIIESNVVRQYVLSTPWIVNTATYLSTFSTGLATANGSVVGIFIGSSGTKMYLAWDFVTNSPGESIRQYTLSTAWDISTAVYDNVAFSITQDTGTSSVTFGNNGTRMYITGNASDIVYQYNLSTAWNIATAVYSSGYSVTARDTSPRGVVFSSDGTKMYVLGNYGRAIYQFNLSTAWNANTASYSSKVFTLGYLTSSVTGVYVSSDGTKFYASGTTDASIVLVYQIGLTTAWDLATATYTAPSHVTPNYRCGGSAGLNLVSTVGGLATAGGIGGIGGGGGGGGRGSTIATNARGGDGGRGEVVVTTYF